MDKNQVIEILNSKGYSAHDTNGILYVDLADIGQASISKIRTMLSDLHYYNSWGIKKIQSGVLPVINKPVNNVESLDYSEEKSEEAEKIFDDSEKKDEDSVVRVGYVKKNPDSDEYEKIDSKEYVESGEGSNSHTDEMYFDENSPFEQVSLFDMMS